MIGTKPAIASLGVWGTLLTIFTVVLQFVDYYATSTHGVAEDVVALIGAAVGLYGRVKAIKQIDRLLP